MRLREFAPSPERDDNDDVPDQLVVLANRWWNATDKQPQIEHVLNSLGWSIHQVESEDDAVQLQHRDGTTYFISADDFDPDLFEISDEPLNELGNAPAEYQPNRKRKRSLFHATVAGHWVDVFFDRSELNDTLHITFAVDGNYEASDQPTEASKSTVKILSTVLNIVKQKLPEYIAKARPPAVSFTAKEDNRSSLYRKHFVPVIQNILGSNWAHEEFPSMNMTVFNWKPVKQIKEIARIPQGDYGSAGTIDTERVPDVDRKELPGGSGFTYGINQKDSDFMEIMMFDQDRIVGELDLSYTQGPMKTWSVENIAVDPAHRGRGIAKALYGIALSILRLPIEAGQIQTRGGQQMWLMLNSIPGVEVVGSAQDKTANYQVRPGDKIVMQDENYTHYTFPIQAGTRSMRSRRPGTGIYTRPDTTMVARWTGS
jgi:GNAT superfamily N-acetyltransferase